MTGSSRPVNQVSEKFPTSRGDSNSATEVAPDIGSNVHKKTKSGGGEVNTPEVSVRYTFRYS